mmetsp:Transcript_55/g.132  ORF Transcript_55/g.132 Transcript_55/m.132 type:complete len:268 (+) Transcript_55:1351-2154(+)
MLVGIQAELRVQERVQVPFHIYLVGVVEAMDLTRLVHLRAVHLGASPNPTRIWVGDDRDLLQALLEAHQEPAELPSFHGDPDGVQVEINLGLEGIRIDEVELKALLQAVLAIDVDDHLVRLGEDLEDRPADPARLQRGHQRLGQQAGREHRLLEELVHVEEAAVEGHANVSRVRGVHAPQVYAPRTGLQHSLVPELAQSLHAELQRPQLLLRCNDPQSHGTSNPPHTHTQKEKEKEEKSSGPSSSVLERTGREPPLLKSLLHRRPLR